VGNDTFDQQKNSWHFDFTFITKHNQFKMNIPLIWIAAFVALCIFYYYKSKEKIRRQQRRDQLDEKRQEFLDALLKSKRKEKGGDA
jgi:hypothetical protein